MSRDVSKISQIILGYYNSKYNKNEKKVDQPIQKSQQGKTKAQRNTLNYNKLIILLINIIYDIYLTHFE